jgi:hypothetical protein
MKKSEAKQLLADCDLATSDSAAITALVAMSDERFVRFRNTGKLDGDTVTHPILAEIRATTLRRNLETATRRREEKKVAEAKRQEEANKIAEAKRQESERLARETALRAADSAKAAKKRTVYEAAELIRAKLIGDWRLGAEGNFLQFVYDGTFSETQKIQPARGLALRGLWAVRTDGTIRILHSDFSADVTMNLDGDEISIAVTDPSGRGWEVKGSKFRGKWNDPIRKRTSPIPAISSSLMPSSGPASKPMKITAADLPPAPPADADNAAKNRWQGNRVVRAFVEDQCKALVDRRSKASLRCQAAENLKALGPTANNALTAFADAALNDDDKEVKRTALETLSEMGRCEGIEPIGRTLLETRDPEMAQAAEDSLLKLLPSLARKLGMNHAVILVEVQDWANAHAGGNQRVPPAIDSALAASGFTKDAVANELDKRRAQKQREKEEAVVFGKVQALRPAALVSAVEKESDADVKRKAMERLGELGALVAFDTFGRTLRMKTGLEVQDTLVALRRGTAAIGRTLLQPGIDPATARAAENSLLKLLPAVGGSLTPNTLFILFDVHRLGNRRLSPAIKNAWAAAGFEVFFTAYEKYYREHPGGEAAEQREYAATHGGKKKLSIRELPERWQRELMTPDRPKPDFGETLRKVIDFDRRVNAERKLEEQSRRNNGIRN